MTVTSDLVAVCRSLYREMPGEGVLPAARRCLVDSIAAGFSAIGEASIGILTETTGTLDGAAAGARGATVLGGRRGYRPADAALINGTMISLQLFDDNCETMRGHPSAPVWPAVLAVAESQGRSLDEALRAFAVGFEVECQLGIYLNPSHYETGWHATATQGVIAATVVASLLMDLDEQQSLHALGIAASMTSGLRRNFGTQTMSLHSGLAAGNGVRAAQWAAKGFTADPDVFAGAMNYGQVFSREWPAAQFAASLKDWGRPPVIATLGGPIFKLFPCGRPALYGLQCAMEIQEQYHLDPAGIEHIRCEVSFMFPRTLIHARPATGLQGKTSYQYCVAAALLEGRPTLATFTDAAVCRPEVAALIEKTEIVVPPELSEAVPEVRKAPFDQPVAITIRMQDGRTIRHTVRHLKGSPYNPAEERDLRFKFTDCVVPHLGKDGAAAVLACIDDPQTRVADLMAKLALPGGA